MFKRTSANWVRYDKYEWRESEKGIMKELKQRIQSFAECFGLLGLMTALPTTPGFTTYDAVYLPKNHFMKKADFE